MGHSSLTYGEAIVFTDEDRKVAFRTLEQSRRKREQRRERLNKQRDGVLCSGYHFNRTVLIDSVGETNDKTN